MSTPSDIEALYRAARDGHRRSLGRLLTLVERGGSDAEVISDLAHPHSGTAHIMGVTGAPGSGKSTLVGQLVARLVADGHQPAILAVDPSSPLTGGAILGDRIRMDDVVDPAAAAADGKRRAFIRSMATRGHSGGLALAVPLAVRLFDAVGYAPVIIETVGVGQVEVEVVGAADTAIVVVTPGMGDAVQANKADRPGANDVRRDLDLMLDLSHLTGQEAPGGYRPPIVMSSAIDGTGADDVLAAASEHLAYLDSSGQRSVRRRQRIRTEIQARMEEKLAELTETVLRSEVGVGLVADAEQGDVSPTKASSALLEQLFQSPSD